MGFVSCTTWVRKGVATSNPKKIELKVEELQRIIKETQSALKNEDSDEEEISSKEQFDNEAHALGQCSTAGNDEYNFNNYDEESGNIHCHINNIASFEENGKDPLVTNDDDDSDKEDDIILSDDNLVIIGRVDDADMGILEVFVYNEKEGSFYCHHDILLPSYPVCMEWLNYDTSDPKAGNLCALGTLNPIIEIWDLDLLDCLEPAYKLGRKPSKKFNRKRIGHKDAVVSLAWNQNYTHVLASSSADKTILLWDLENCKPVTKFNLSNGMVSTIKWHPQETHHLLTGSEENVVQLYDCKEEIIIKGWKASGGVEKVLWNHYDTNYCIIGTDKGYMEYLDVRINEPIWKIAAHSDEITGLSLSSSCRDLLVSSSMDGTIKVWDLGDHKEPTFVWEKQTGTSGINCLDANPENGFVFAAGGFKKSYDFQILDLSEMSEVRERFTCANHVASHSSASKSNERQIMDVTENMEDMEIESMKTIKKEMDT